MSAWPFERDERAGVEHETSSTTITGSIGVVAARLSVDPLLARLGIC